MSNAHGALRYLWYTSKTPQKAQETPLLTILPILRHPSKKKKLKKSAVLVG